MEEEEGKKMKMTRKMTGWEEEGEFERSEISRSKLAFHNNDCEGGFCVHQMHTDNNTTQFKCYMTMYMKSHTYHDDNVASRWHPTTLDACKHMRETRACKTSEERTVIDHTITACQKGDKISHQTSICTDSCIRGWTHTDTIRDHGA